jgi:hypothetical protein
LIGPTSLTRRKSVDLEQGTAECCDAIIDRSRP